MIIVSHPKCRNWLTSPASDDAPASEYLNLKGKSTEKNGKRKKEGPLARVNGRINFHADKS